MLSEEPAPAERLHRIGDQEQHTGRRDEPWARVLERPAGFREVQRSEHGEASEPPVDEHRVLADPTQPRKPREVAFEQGRRVGHSAAADGRYLGT